MRKRKSWEELEIKDDFMFAKVMRDKETCKKVLEKLLHTKIANIWYLEEQKTIDISLKAKSVRLDVLLEDGKRIFNIEMQTSDKDNLAKRSRYYQGMIDLNDIEKGAFYDDLKESFVIFICTFDPFQKGLPHYSFQNRCAEEHKILLNDGTHKIFFNTMAYDKEKDLDIRAFLKYINGESSENELVKEIEKKVEQVKLNKQWRGEYMTLLMLEQQRYREGLEQGREQGREQGLEQGIYAMVSAFKSMKISSEQIIEQLMKQFLLTKEEAVAYVSGEKAKNEE